MTPQHARELAEAWGRISAAAKRWAGRHEAAEIAAEMAVQAAEQAHRLDVHLAPQFMRRRVEDARRSVYGRSDALRNQARRSSAEPACDQPTPAERVEAAHDKADDADLEAWLNEVVDTGEALRREREARVALGGLPPRIEELAALANRICELWPPGRHMTRGEVVVALRR